MAHLQQLKAKIFRHTQAFLPTLHQWQHAGLKTVFTNGCFDILHRGHIDYLAQAADLADKLIIGLNTDQSVSRLKGSHRPLQDQMSRAHVMAALSFVDAVVLFDEDTPYDLIKSVVPNILVKGADYKPEDIVGYDIVTQAGGQIQTIEFVPGYSTSAIEAKILNSKADSYTP